MFSADARGDIKLVSKQTNTAQGGATLRLKPVRLGVFLRNEFMHGYSEGKSVPAIRAHNNAVYIGQVKTQED
jgi:hypothetical protein